jgi:hypothetical protein
MTLLESPVPWTQAVRIREAPSSSGGGGGRVFLKADWAVFERRRPYCDSEREIDMATIEKRHWQMCLGDRCCGGRQMKNRKRRRCRAQLGQCNYEAVYFLFRLRSTPPHHMSNPLPSIPKPDDPQLPSPEASTPSIPSIFDDCQARSLRSSASLPIVPPTANVQFAPLPEINPRDRRPTRPLGMAGRSLMLQQRRIQMQNGQRHPREWSDPDGRPMVYIPDEEEEDPLESFVRFIADKSKSLWKRVASKPRQSDEDETTDIASDAAVVEGEPGAVQPRPPNREGEPLTHSNQAKGISKK